MTGVSDTIDVPAVLAELRSIAVDPADVVGVVAAAVVETYRRLVDNDPSIRANIDIATGSVNLFRGDTQIELPEGDVARQAAQAARVAVSARLRQIDTEQVLRDATLHQGELIDTIVERRQGQNWLLRAGHDQWSVLPPEEQMAGEELEHNRHLKVVVVEGRRRGQDAVMVVSRSHPQLLRLLLEQEVPEIVRGDVVIKAIAREAGKRSKVAVWSAHPELDAQGACIGPKGIRHRSIVAELSAEQVQIIAWEDDPALYIGNALAPAPVASVTLDEETRTASVKVAKDKLSLAIGRGGENARLAARLTGWRIDITPEGE